MMHIVGMEYEKYKQNFSQEIWKKGIIWRPRHSWEYNLENGL